MSEYAQEVYERTFRTNPDLEIIRTYFRTGSQATWLQKYEKVLYPLAWWVNAIEENGGKMPAKNRLYHSMVEAGLFRPNIIANYGGATIVARWGESNKAAPGGWNTLIVVEWEFDDSYDPEAIDREYLSLLNAKTYEVIRNFGLTDEESVELHYYMAKHPQARDLRDVFKTVQLVD